MFKRLLIAALLAQPLGLGAARADVFAGEQSRKSASEVSVQVEPRLSDGRLVVKLAAKNGGTAPVAFGSGNLAITAADGSRIAWRPLPALIGDVEAAYGLSTALPEAPMATQSTATNTAPQRGFQTDVSNYTGGSAVAQMEAVNSGSRQRKRRKVSAADKAKAEAEIAQLKAAVVQDGSLAPGQVAAGMLVSEKVKSTLVGTPVTLTITIGADQHSFNFAVPAAQ